MTYTVRHKDTVVASVGCADCCAGLYRCACVLEAFKFAKAVDGTVTVHRGETLLGTVCPGPTYRAQLNRRRAERKAAREALERNTVAA